MSDGDDLEVMTLPSDCYYRFVKNSTERGFIDITNAAAMNALASSVTLGIFELIRRRRGGMTIAAGAQASGLSQGAIARSLDTLVEIGLLKRVRASKGRLNRYAVTCQQIIIVADPHCDEHVKAIRAHFESATTDVTEALRAADKFTGVLRNDQHRLDVRMKLNLRPEEWVEFKRLSRNLVNFLESVSQARSGRASDCPELCDHVLSIQVTPCEPPLLPSPSISITSRKHLDQKQPTDSLGEHTRLTSREQQVVILINANVKRQEIASQLGVSLNTIVTLASRAYKKLGVNSRGALKARLARMPIDVERRATEK
jgi:DNA-binding CsgD family transcriptional regulator/DNA-binding MarR family transcriptional regulator